MMGRITYSDGRTALTTTAFRYKLTDSTGTLVKDWTSGATWTEEPAGTYYLDDAAAVPGTRYAVEPATGEVGGVGMVPWGKPAATGDAMTLTAAYDKAKDDVLTPLATKASQASVDAIPTTPLLAANYVEPDNAGIAAAAASAASADGKATTLLARNNPLNAAATQAAAQAAIVAESVSTFNATSDPVEVGGLSVDGAADVRDALGMAAADLDEQLEGIGTNAQTAAGWDFGDDVCTITIRDTTGIVLSDAQVYITDSAGHQSRTKTTDSLGQVKFDLTSGQSYNLWVTHDRYTGAVPVVFVASEDV